LLFETEFENLLEYDSGVHMGLIHGRNRGQKSCATVPLKSSQKQKTPGGKKYFISSFSTAQNMPKIAEVKLSSCGLRKKLRLGNCGVAVVEKHFLKSCGIANCGSASFKLRNSNCGLKKKLRVPTSV
jgi:hypothetical protein